LLHIINTIVPVFAVILLGLAIRSTGYLPREIIGPLNRLVFYIAIPAMIFRALAKASFSAHFDPYLLAGTLVPVVVVFALSIGLARLTRIPRHRRGTFVQSCFHGNLGYIGFAVVFYLLGETGFTSASILAGFLMLLQNFLSVLTLQLFSPDHSGGRKVIFILKKVLVNPVILSAMAGIAFSLAGLTLPVTAQRTLAILSGMALPLALLVIGASLSPALIRTNLKYALTSGVIKLLVLPAAGLVFYYGAGLAPARFLPGLILLASPTATITYVMASEMNGSVELASAAISLNTLLSALSFLFWLGLLH
jgi:predicted permease